MNAKTKMECQIIIDKNDIEKEKMTELIFRLERIANTSNIFRVHINNIGSLYQMMIGTNAENISEKDFKNEIYKIDGIANILEDNMECHIRILQTIGE